MKYTKPNLFWSSSCYCGSIAFTKKKLDFLKDTEIILLEKHNYPNESLFLTTYNETIENI